MRTVTIPLEEYEDLKKTTKYDVEIEFAPAKTSIRYLSRNFKLDYKKAIEILKKENDRIVVKNEELYNNYQEYKQMSILKFILMKITW